MFPVFVLFGKTVPLYGVAAVAGALTAGIYVCRRFARLGYDDNDAILAMLVAAPGALAGGSLLYGITNMRLLPSLFSAHGFSEFVSRFSEMFGGLVYYGGLAGALTAGFLFAKIRKTDLSALADTAAPAIALFHSIARIGCFLGGCCYGIESPFGFTAHNNPYVPQINDVRRFPVQLLESAAELAIFFLLNSLFLKIRGFRAGGTSTGSYAFLRGKLLPLYFVIYPAVRFFDEFLRGDDIRGFVFGGALSTSQFISVLLLSGSVLYFAVSYKKYRSGAVKI